jgi:hypothetical protein
LQPHGAVFAQLLGGVNSNLNMNPAIAPCEIVFPGDRSLRPAHEQVPVSDLYIQHNQQRDMLELRSRSIDRRVIPLYLGFLIPAALPDLCQLLLKFSPVTWIPALLLLPDKAAPAADEIVYSPRVRYGSIVLQRASWSIPCESMPHRADAAGDAEHMVAVLRWRRAHGLPGRGFLKSTGRPSFGAEDAKPQDSDDGAKLFAGMTHKPMFVDFDSHFCLGLVDRLVSKKKSRVQLTECLPDKDELCLRTPQGGYVTEFMIELNRAYEEV